MEDEEAELAEGVRVRITALPEDVGGEEKGEEEGEEDGGGEEEEGSLEEEEMAARAREHWKAFLRWLHFQKGTCGGFDAASGRYTVVLDQPLGGGASGPVSIPQVC